MSNGNAFPPSIDSPDPGPGTSTGQWTSFDITHETAPNEAVLAGFATFGLAGLTAVNFIVDQLDLEETGHISTETLPAITPFENGTPRHHTRFFSRDDLDVTVLAGELFVPVSAASAFSGSIFEWLDESAVSEVTVLSGVPIPHGPDEHRTFYIATTDYQERRLDGTDVPPMGSGFLDGTNAALMARGIESPLAVGVFVTPVHAQAPDVEAAIRLVETARDVYELPLDTTPLKEFATRVQTYYQELADRLENVEEGRAPEDRMYM